MWGLLTFDDDFGFFVHSGLKQLGSFGPAPKAFALVRFGHLEDDGALGGAATVLDTLPDRLEDYACHPPRDLRRRSRPHHLAGHGHPDSGRYWGFQAMEIHTKGRHWKKDVNTVQILCYCYLLEVTQPKNGLGTTNAAYVILSVITDSFSSS